MTATAWISIHDNLPEGNPRMPGGVSDEVLVSVRCSTRLYFTSIDSYDPHTATWNAHLGSHDGRHVTHWMPLPLPVPTNLIPQ